MKIVELHHATWTGPDSKPVEVSLDANMIFAAFVHPELKCTLVMGPGNAHLTVLESPQEVMSLKGASKPLDRNKKQPPPKR